ncbi:hypothetical protein SAMN04487977_101539 [Treponema bryantii]|uniref:Uncharacterized protein n=1 Tax=Treponema bryantii TaxID=163 RepID=A0A1H9B1K8_9SPIR|nr:hypothetical protein [Treponema bryantii]SEP82591.1 hypothetical protein SAMN04487977_101539 [Treponema bryantii]
MEWFGSAESIEQLKGEYLNLLKRWKSDADIKKEIDEQYVELLERFGVELNKRIDEENKELPVEKQKIHYDFSKDTFKDVLNKVIDFNMRIEIIGQWIWCFESKEYKDQLKELGFWFSASKKAWVYSGTKKKHIYSHNKMNDIRAKWGVEVVKEKEVS